MIKLMGDKMESIDKIKEDKTYTADEFILQYNKLCKEYGFLIIPIPKWVQSKDTGDFRLSISLETTSLPKETT